MQHIGNSWRRGLRLVAVCALAQLLVACSGGGGGSEGSGSAGGGASGGASVSGVAQKGPLLAGGSITAAQLEGDQQVSARLGPKGGFSLTLPWTGPTAFTVRGRFYHELTGTDSKRPVTLRATVDVQQDTRVNLNLFTTLLQQRLDQLMAQGESFASARQTAEDQLGELLGLDLPAGKRVEDLDLTDGEGDADNGGGNASLLLFSATVLQQMQEDEGGGSDGGGNGLDDQLGGLFSDFADDGLMDGAGLPDWEKVLNGGNRDVLARARQGLGNIGNGNLPQIPDNRPLPGWAGQLRVNVLDAARAEGGAGQTPLRVRVRLSAPAPGPVSVRFRALADTADSSDFQAVDQRVSFSHGEVIKTVEVPIFGDTVQEPIENLALVLTDPVDVDLGRALGRGTIVNDDGAIVPAPATGFQIDEFLPVALRDGDRSLPLSGLAAYRHSDKALVGEFLVGSSVACPGGKPEQCPDKPGYLAIVDLVTADGSAELELGSVYVAPDEVRYRDLQLAQGQAKLFDLELDQTGFDSFVADALAQGKTLQFRITAHVQDSVAKAGEPTASAAAPAFLPHADSVEFGDVVTTAADFTSLGEDATCTSGYQLLPRLRVTGSADWQPAPSGWPGTRVAFVGMCVDLRLNAARDAFVFGATTGHAEAGDVSGSLGGISVVAEDNQLDAGGAKPATLHVTLPAGHSWHETDAATGRPKARGSASLRVQVNAYPADPADYRTLRATETGGFLHARGLPFSLELDYLTLDNAGINGEFAGVHYNFDQAYHSSDPRQSNRLGPVANDARFAKWDASGYTPLFSLDDQGLDVPLLRFRATTVRTHFPSTRLQVQAGTEIAVANGRLVDGQSLDGNDRYRFEFAGDCSGCTAGATQAAYDLAAVAASGLAADAAVTVPVTGLVDPAWGPEDAKAGRRIFRRSGDALHNGIVYLPGIVAANTAQGRSVAEYLLGSRALRADGNALLPAQAYALSDGASRRGNHAMAGLTVGPEIYRDSRGQPVVGVGEDLSGTATDVGLGGLPDPVYRTVASNLGSKYVVRPGGLTGVFNSDVAPGQVNIYGYEMNLRRFGFRLVANQLDDYSWIDGAVRLAGEAGFSVNFSSLGLECTGDVGGGLVDRDACGASGLGDGIDDNGNGINDENCGATLAAWQLPSQFRSLRFAAEGEPAACAAQTRQLQIGHSLTAQALSKPVGLLATWEADGNLAAQRVRTGDSARLDQPSAGAGFPTLLQSMVLKDDVGEQGNGSYGWLQFVGQLGVPFWETLKVDGRVANSSRSEAEQTVLLRQGVLSDQAGDAEDAQTNPVLAQSAETDSSYDITAWYEWGNTGWRFGLPVYYETGRLATDQMPNFLGRRAQMDLIVLEAGGGINHINPLRTRLSFGASADFDRLRQLSAGWQVDFNDPDSLAAVDDLLEGMGAGRPVQSALEQLRGKVDLMNSLVGPGLDSMIEQALDEAVLQAGQQVGQSLPGGDPFVQVADGLARVQTLPAQLANGVADRLNGAVDQAVQPLTDDLDQALTGIYNDLPGLLRQAAGGNPASGVLDQLNSYARSAGDAVSALDEVDAALARAEGAVGDARQEIDRLNNTIGSWAGEVDSALAAVQNDVLGRLDLASCEITGSGNQLTTDHPLFKPALDALVNTRAVAQRLQGLRALRDIAQPVAAASGIDMQPALSAQRQIQDLAEVLAQRANAALQQVEAALCPGGSGGFAGALNDVNTLLSDIRNRVQGVAGRFQSLRANLAGPLNAAESSIADARRDLGGVRDFLGDLQGMAGQAASGQSFDYDSWSEQQIRDALNSTAQSAFGHDWYDATRGQSFIVPLSRDLRAPVETVVAQLQQQIQAQLAQLAAYVPVKSADELRGLIADQILNSPPVQDLLVTMNDQVAAIVEELNSVVLVVLDQVNYLVQEALKAVEDTVNQALAAASTELEALPIATAGMDGFAVIAGQELERAHLGAEWTLRGEAEENTISYNAALDVTSWNANGKAEGCDLNVGDYGAPLDAVISTRDLPIGVGGAEVLIRKLYLGFTLQQVAQTLGPVGLFGGITTSGDLDFEAFTLYDIGFAAGTGAYENYVGATAGALFDSLQMSAAFLVGKTCNDEVIKTLDPQVGEFLTLPGGVFNGAYARGSASVPVWNNGCALTVGVSADVGAWALVGPPVTFGGLVGGGAYGKVLCIGALRGQVMAIGEKSGDSYSFGGSGFGVAGAGFDCDPGSWTSVSRSRRDDWCGTGDASFGASYRNGWQVEGLSTSAIH